MRHSTEWQLKLPFLIAAFVSFVLSVWLYFISDEPEIGIFVGLWVPSILSLGAFLSTPSAVHRERV